MVTCNAVNALATQLCNPRITASLCNCKAVKAFHESCATIRDSASPDRRRSVGTPFFSKPGRASPGLSQDGQRCISPDPTRQ